VIRNNAGGYYNHSCIGNLWLQTPEVNLDTLAAAISKDFGSYENFVTTLKVKQLNSLVLLGLAGR
jgi:Fe-Mn family superoxide dismutase